MAFSIWPPTKRTREAVMNRLIETLSSPSILSKRYGLLTQEEASTTARFIEEQAFSIASNTIKKDEDGFDVLQVYSKEISKRMLETVKSRALSYSTLPHNASATAAAGDDDEIANKKKDKDSVSSEEISSITS
ncbi:Wpp domain-containing protein [Thalictrum thalictroides]|uniref:Wpp domain-containing protein n=1 Tax=Thalictrum thalictroides TaxID=46969 RepID=A0A7J6X727_THATH|nr:Wpp domain-containing protein [Thalictrum thalictroides]